MKKMPFVLGLLATINNEVPAFCDLFDEKSNYYAGVQFLGSDRKPIVVCIFFRLNKTIFQFPTMAGPPSLGSSPLLSKEKGGIRQSKE